MTTTVVVGAGLTGALLAARLGEQGDHVILIERRPDPRIIDVDQNRSINLAISHRGLDALSHVGLDGRVRAIGVTMRGRRIHDADGDLTFQPYGVRDDEVLFSVDRGALNNILIDHAESQPNVELHFASTVEKVDSESGAVAFTKADQSTTVIEAQSVIGADGTNSIVRDYLRRGPTFDFEEDRLEHGYKELTIPPGPDGQWLIDPHALHIWPRGTHMMIALPNPEGSFTATLFWPYAGPNGFDTVASGADAVEVFAEQFPDALALMPDLESEFDANPVGRLGTVRCWPWFQTDRVLLVGDAAHAVVPFYGQGANAAMEDVTLLCDALARHPANRAAAFADFANTRKPHTDALADLALENYIEMRDHVASRWFLARRRLDRALARRFPETFSPLYTMVSFSRVPYRDAVKRARRQDQAISVGLAAVVAAAIGGAAKTIHLLSGSRREP